MLILTIPPLRAPIRILAKTWQAKGPTCADAGGGDNFNRRTCGMGQHEALALGASRQQHARLANGDPDAHRVNLQKCNQRNQA